MLQRFGLIACLAALTPLACAIPAERGSDSDAGDTNEGIGGSDRANTSATTRSQGGVAAQGGAMSTGAGGSGMGTLATTSSNTLTSSPTGGFASTGGLAAFGGVAAAGGFVAAGGSVASGGLHATGGLVATGGLHAAGGLVATGGLHATGGLLSTAGAVATGGALATGGMVATGGLLATGGAQPTGGVSAVGGASTTCGRRDCTSALDNDCNGTPDNQESAYCVCGVPNQAVDCTPSPTQLGECAKGKKVCTLAADNSTSNWSACVSSATRVRDCRSPNDNDCNGIPDNTIDSTCQCALGSQPAACNVAGEKGACIAGTKTCQTTDDTSTHWGDCVSINQKSMTEVCGPTGDAIADDSNCNGHIGDGEGLSAQCTSAVHVCTTATGSYPGTYLQSEPCGNQPDIAINIFANPTDMSKVTALYSCSVSVTASTPYDHNTVTCHFLAPKGCPSGTGDLMGYLANVNEGNYACLSFPTTQSTCTATISGGTTQTVQYPSAPVLSNTNCDYYTIQ